MSLESFIFEPITYNVIGGSLSLSKQLVYANSVFGFQAGVDSTYGNLLSGFVYNIGIGQRALASCLDETYTIAVGRYAAISNVSSHANILLGHETGQHFSNSRDSTYIGTQVGQSQARSKNNIFLGMGIGTGQVPAVSNSCNIIIGKESFRDTYNATSNIVFGTRSLVSSFDVNESIMIGHSIGTLSSVHNSIRLGNACLPKTQGRNTIAIGHGLGETDTFSIALSNTLYIGNSLSGLSEYSNNLVMGYGIQHYMRADFSTNEVQLTASSFRIGGVRTNPTFSLIRGDGTQTIPNSPIVFVDKLYTGKNLTFDTLTQSSSRILSKTYNYDQILVNNTARLITVCGIFLEQGRPFSETFTTDTIRRNSARKYTQLALEDRGNVTQLIYIRKPDVRDDLAVRSLSFKGGVAGSEDLSNVSGQFHDAIYLDNTLVDSNLTHMFLYSSNTMSFTLISFDVVKRVDSFEDLSTVSYNSAELGYSLYLTRDTRRIYAGFTGDWVYTGLTETGVVNSTGDLSDSPPIATTRFVTNMSRHYVQTQTSISWLPLRGPSEPPDLEPPTDVSGGDMEDDPIDDTLEPETSLSTFLFSESAILQTDASLTSWTPIYGADGGVVPVNGGTAF